MWLFEDVTSKLFHMAGISRQQFYIPLLLISICPFIITLFPWFFLITWVLRILQYTLCLDPSLQLPHFIVE
jgi:hypothetical protein